MPTYTSVPTTIANTAVVGNQQTWGLASNEVQVLDGSFNGVSPYYPDPPAPGVPIQMTATQSTVFLCSAFGFAVPATEIVTNITVNLYRRRDDPVYAGTNLRDYLIKLLTGVAVTGTNKADTGTNWPAAVTLKTYSDSPTGWGVSYLPSFFNASGFGVGVQIEGLGGPVPLPITGDGPPIGLLDQVQIVLTTILAGVRPLSGDNLANPNPLRSMVIR